MKKLHTFMAAVLAFGAGTVIHTEVAHAQASTVGQVRGVIKDKGTNENAVGATVVATSPALQGEQVVITDENGQYFITSLPPGMYTLTVYYNASTYARGNVLVQVGKEVVVNVVTKQGSNEFHGSVFGNYSPASFTSAAKIVPAEGGSIDTSLDTGNYWDAGFELGGPIIKDKLWFHVGFDPSVNDYSMNRIVQSQVDVNQDGVADIDPATGLIKHDEVTRAPVEASQKTYYFTGKINGAIDQNNQFQVSVFGNPRNSVLPCNSLSSPGVSRFGPYALSDNVLNTTSGAEDVSAQWASKLNGGETQVGAVLGCR